MDGLIFTWGPGGREDTFQALETICAKALKYPEILIIEKLKNHLVTEKGQGMKHGTEGRTKSNSLQTM